MTTIEDQNPTGSEIIQKDKSQVEGDIVQNSIDAANIIDVSHQQVDITSLPVEVQDELKADAARKMIENQDRAIKLGQDVNALGTSLGEMARTGAEMSEAGMSFTATNTRDDNLGRTEVMIGNSETAQRGKLTRTQTSKAGNFSTQTLIIIGIVITAVVVIAVAFASNMG